MRNGIIRAVTWLIAAFVYFHAPNGDWVVINPSDGQVIIRPSPPGYPPHTTMIQTGAGNAIVTETVCEVAHALEQRCAKDKVKAK